MPNSEIIISSKRGLFKIDLKSVWEYRDLLRMFVYRFCYLL